MITFQISKKLSQIFDFLTSYFDIDRTNLLVTWRKMGVKYPSYSTSFDPEKISYRIDINNLSDYEKNSLFLFFNDILKIDRSIWLEGHISEFCVQYLDKMKAEISGYVSSSQPIEPIKLRRRTKHDPSAQIPKAFKDYLFNSTTESAAYQYDVAFRNNIVPQLKAKTGENFWDIKDLQRIMAMHNAATGLHKTALKYYINFLQKENDSVIPYDKNHY